MLVAIAILVLIFSWILDCIKWTAALQLSRTTGRSFDECLAAAKGTTVKELRRERAVNAACLMVGVIVTAVLWITGG